MVGRNAAILQPRQLASFGDNMNVAATLRPLQDDWRLTGELGDLARQIKSPDIASIGEPRLVDVRGRSERVEALAVRLTPTTPPRVRRPS
jgi:hypothetical protein